MAATSAAAAAAASMPEALVEKLEKIKSPKLQNQHHVSLTCPDRRKRYSFDAVSTEKL